MASRSSCEEALDLLLPASGRLSCPPFSSCCSWLRGLCNIVASHTSRREPGSSHCRKDTALSRTGLYGHAVPSWPTTVGRSRSTIARTVAPLRIDVKLALEVRRPRVEVARRIDFDPRRRIYKIWLSCSPHSPTQPTHNRRCQYEDCSILTNGIAALTIFDLSGFNF